MRIHLTYYAHVDNRFAHNESVILNPQLPVFIFLNKHLNDKIF